MDPIKDYYEYLKRAGADVAPTVDSFINTLNDQKTAIKYYDYLKGGGFDVPSTFESFSNTLGIGKKKDGTTVQSSTPSPSSSIPSISDLAKSFKKPQVSDAPSATQRIETSIKAQDKAQGNVPVLPTLELHNKEVQAAKTKVANTIQNSDRIIDGLIREGRVSQLESQISNTPRLDGMPMPALQTAKKDIFTKIPVSQEEITVKKNEAIADPALARKVISRSAKNDPTLGKSMYLLDAEERTTKDPNRTATVLDNAKKIEEGELRYNINRGILEKPENFILSGIRGFKERSQQLDDYNFFTQTKNDDAIISQLEADMKDVDPDRPVPVAEGGTSQFTQMLGMEGIPMLKSSASAIVTGMIPGGQAAAPFVAAAVSSPEYYKRSYASALRESYYQLRQAGKDEREALATARKQAEAEGRLGAAEGAISSAVGAKIGFKPINISSSPGLKGALTNLVKAGGNFAKESIPEGVSDGLVAGALQIAKNVEAQNNGLNRDIMDGVNENVAGEVFFALGSGALISGGKTLLNPETYNTIKTYIARQPKEVVDAKIGEMVLTGKATPKKAVEFAKEIEETRAADAKIPDSVTDVAVRTEIQGKIKERDDLKAKLATVDPVFHKPIQEQINNIESDILNMSSAPVAPELSKIESLSPDAIEVSGNAEGFAQQMTDAQKSLGNAGLSVSPYAQEDYDQIAQEGGKFLRADGGKILGLLKPNGEMVSLVKSAASSVKGAAQAMITKMKDMGGLFMDNYDIYLTPLYEKAGYKVVARVPFNEEYAPEGWNAEDSTLKNKPDVVFMVRADMAPGEAVKFENYEDAQAYTQGLVDKAIADGKAQLPSTMAVDEKGQLIDTKLQDAVSRASRSLEKSGIKFNIIDSSVNPEQADAARGNQAIFRDTDGTVTIDRSKLANDIEAGIVVWHESSHPVINIIRNTDRKLYDAVVRGLTDAAKKNAGVQKALNWAEDGYEGNDVQADEALVETIARIAEGVVDMSKLDTGLRQRIVDFINDIANFFGIDPILNNTDLAEFKRVATQVAEALTQGRDIAEIVGDKNVKEYMNTLPSPSAIASGEYTPQAKVAGGIDVYASKETESLPTKTLQEIYDMFGGRAVVINSDPTRVGELKLPSGKTIFMYGGPGYLSVKDNVNGNVGFATTQLSKVKTWQKYVNELFGNDKGVTFVATQAPTSILSNSYALRYVMDAISMLPKSVLKSSEFKSEFFGKDLVLLKDAFGEKAYNDFVSKYKKADLSDAKVIDEMIAEMAYKVGDDNKPASFKARGAFVSNLLGGVEAKKKLKTVEGDSGYVSKKPTKYISGQLFNRLGINAEKVMREIGEPSLVDLWFNEGKWGMVVSGFETDPNVSIDSVQDGGVKHPLFNAKFPGKNPFVFDGAYEVDSMFKPVEITGPSGAPYTKRAAQMLAGSMYVKGQSGSTDTAFEYTPTAPAAEKIRASVGNRSEDDLRAEGKGKERDRALASKFGALSDETQAKIDDDAVTYFQRPNKQTEKAVEEFIDGINLIDAADYVLSNPAIPEVSKVWMAATVAKRLNAEIDAAKAANDDALVDALTSKQADIYNEFAKKATSLGQAVQAFIAFRNDPNAAEFFLPKILRQLKKAGVEDVTEEQKQEILGKLREVNKAAEGLPKDKAIIDLSHYLAGIAPMKPMDVIQALWYAKILSGITTQATNLFANMFNTMFELPAVGIRIALMSGNPMAVLYGMKGFAGGVAKGAVAAADIIKSGVKSKEADKYFSENPLEYFTWSRWMGKKGEVLDKIPPLNFGAWKYVGRFLSATDAMFSTANQEAVANMLAYAEAGGNPGTAKFRQVNQLLGNTKMNILRANAQAKAEGFDIKSLQGKRRVIEIVNQNRGTKITEEADAIGKRITMNYEPEGWTKPIFDAVVGLQRNIPAIKMVIPFARIVANLTENSLNYTPFGLVRAATGKRNPFNKSGDKLTTEERVDLLSKFAIGMGALAILATKVGEDDDDWFELTAGGPADPQQKYELMKGKWRPYTITLKNGKKISYKDWPIAGILAGMGHIRDAKKYSFDDSTQLGLYATGFFLNFYDKSLMSGLSDFFGIAHPNLGRGKYAPGDDGWKRFEKYAAQQVKSVALSNLAQQTGKLYSELVTGDPQRDARTFMEVLYRDMPVMNDGVRPIIDVFGEPVPYTTTERLTPVSDPEGDELIEWLNENKFWVGVPKRQNIFDLATKTERPMTDDEYYEYRKLSGQKTKAWINRLINQVKSDRREVSEAAFEAAKEAAREQAYFEIIRKSR